MTKLSIALLMGVVGRVVITTKAWELRRRDPGVKVLTVVFMAVFVTGCATMRTARLYDVGSPTIITASYRTNGSGRGLIFLGDEKQPECRGEYVTVSGGDTAWGAVFNGSSVTQGVAVSTANDQRGSAVMNCTDGRVFTCEYVTSALTGGGVGACRDNQAHSYRLMF